MASTIKRHTVTPTLCFNPLWEEAYFFVEREGAAKCLLCHMSTNQFKKYNLQRHYNSFHAKAFVHYTPEKRIAKLESLKYKLAEIDTDLLEEESKYVNTEPIIQTSYRIALEIARNVRPFSDGEFIKTCLLASAEQLCPDEVHKFEGINLSRQTIQQCIHEMASNASQQLNVIAKKFVVFSLAFDKLIDTSGASQLAVFIRGIDDTFALTEELLDIFFVKDDAKGEDILSCIEEAIKYNNLDWCKLVAVATNGTPSIVDINTEFIDCLQLKLRNLAVPQKVVTIHSIIHIQHLCAKCIQFDNVVSVVVKTTNTIQTYGLQNSQFRSFLEELEAEYVELPYHTNIKWLSCGKILDKYYNLLAEIDLLMNMVGDPVPELQSDHWIADLAFMCDIIHHLNALNVSLQEERKTIIDLFDLIQAFKMKLELWIEQLRTKTMEHFTKLALVSPKINFDKYIDVLKNLNKEFTLRFKDVSTLEKDFDLVALPFSIDIKSAPPYLQLELIDLRCDRNLKQKFMDKVDLIDFYKSLQQSRFPQLYKYAARIMAMFGSTYIFEKLVCMLRKTKNTSNYTVSDHNLKDSLILGTTQTII
nr:general transcription factor II-I repeat domain-containing protein 2-like [Megalopta genalis]